MYGQVGLWVAGSFDGLVVGSVRGWVDSVNGCVGGSVGVWVVVSVYGWMGLWMLGSFDG